MINIVDKERLPLFTFIKAEEDNSLKWHDELKYAMRLGNEHKGKATISFNTTEGVFTVTTTVWFVTHTDLQLKGGMNIPLNSITDVSFA